MDSKAKRARIRRYLAFMLVPLSLVVGVKLTGAAESLAYWPSREGFETPALYEDVWITTSDGVRLHGWFMPARGGAKTPGPAVLHLHGNAGNISHHASFSEYLPRSGVHTLIIDYRCYGRSDDTGPLRRDALLLDARAALDYLLARDDVDADRVGVLGVSLGSAFGHALTAEREEVRAIATIGAFSSWRGIASDMLPVLGPLLIPRGMDQIDALAELGDRPYLIVHGDRDEVIDFRHALLLKARCDELGVSAVLHSVKGGDHNGLLWEYPATKDVISEFFVRSLTP